MLFFVTGKLSRLLAALPPLVSWATRKRLRKRSREKCCDALDERFPVLSDLLSSNMLGVSLSRDKGRRRFSEDRSPGGQELNRSGVQDQTPVLVHLSSWQNTFQISVDFAGSDSAVKKDQVWVLRDWLVWVLSFANLGELLQS